MLHIETNRGVPNQTATALESIGYRLPAPLQDAVDPRNNTAHRFKRAANTVDLVAGAVHDEVVDVLTSDHPAPNVVEKLRGRAMVGIEGGTQALRRTVNARLEVEPGALTTMSVPRPFGAVILKAAAYVTDSRDRDRHLFEAAALLACIEEPLLERDDFRGFRPPPIGRPREGATRRTSGVAAAARIRARGRGGCPTHPVRARLKATFDGHVRSGAVAVAYEW